MLRIPFIAVLLCSLSVFAQNLQRIDSLRGVLKGNPTDTARVQTWNNLGNEYRRFGWDSTFHYGSLALKLSRKIRYRKGEAAALNNIGISFHFRAMYDSAIHYYKQAQRIRREIGEKRGVASGHTNIGIVFYLKGDYDSAMNRHKKAMAIQEELKDTNGMANTCNNMAGVWRYRGNYERALEYFMKAMHFFQRSNDIPGQLYALNNLGIIYASLDKHVLASKTYREGIELAEKTNDKYILAVLYTNLGIEYLDLKKIDDALYCFQKGYDQAREIQTLQGMATCAVNLGRLYLEKNELKKATGFVKEALAYYEKSGEKQGMVSALNLLAQIKLKENSFSESISILNKSMSLCNEVGMMDHLRDAYQNMYAVYKQTGNSKEALHWFKKYSELKDSLFHTGNANTISEMQARFENEKKEKQILLLEKEKNLKDIELAEQQTSLITTNITLLALAILLGLGGFLVGLVIKVIKRRKKINEDLTHLNISILSKKEVIEQHNTEIIQNLELAGEIQKGIIPTPEQMRKVMGDHFILFKPKEIVSGDFYWINSVPSGTLLAVIDCTGHGVPGAYMSVMAYEFMEDICRKIQDPGPAVILNELNQRLSSQRKERSFSDNPGLDISLVLIKKNKKEIVYASSRQPLWVLKNGENNVEEVKPEKKFMGLLADTNFDQIAVNVKDGDRFLLFSDGYSDQIGEQSRKKMLAQVFREQVSKGGRGTGDEVQRTGDEGRGEMEKLGKMLEEFFEKWKGNREQVDDVTVLGFKL